MAPQHVGEGDRDWRDCGEIAGRLQGDCRETARVSPTCWDCQTLGVVKYRGLPNIGVMKCRGDRKGLPAISLPPPLLFAHPYVCIYITSSSYRAVSQSTTSANASRNAVNSSSRVGSSGITLLFQISKIFRLWGDTAFPIM